jgi:tRNA (guanine37-N1)-methyltransferase
MFAGIFGESMLKRAIDAGLLCVKLYDIRDYAANKHRQVDDYPFGGGSGMLMMPQPAIDCIEAAMADGNAKAKRICFTPKGKPLTAKLAEALSKEQELILLCGHYEGIDQRVIDSMIDLEISMGDYVLTGGEIPAMALIDSVSRFIPGVLGGVGSALDESFSGGLLEYPQYTRPAEFRGMSVPDVLLSGNHALIRKWQREQAIMETLKKRPDLLEKADLTEAERKQYLHGKNLPEPR